MKFLYRKPFKYSLTRQFLSPKLNTRLKKKPTMKSIEAALDLTWNKKNNDEFAQIRKNNLDNSVGNDDKFSSYYNVLDIK